MVLLYILKKLVLGDWIASVGYVLVIFFINVLVEILKLELV